MARSIFVKRIELVSRLKLLLAGVAMAFASVPSNASDLIDVYRLALLNDPQFEVARYELKAELQMYPQALSEFLPDIVARGENSLSQVDNQFSSSPSVDREIHSWNWSIELTQPLIRIQSMYGYDNARMAVELAKTRYQLAQQDIILRVAESYFGVLSAKEEIDVIKAELAAAEAQLEQAKKGHEKGVVALTDVLEANSRLSLAYSDIAAAQSEYQIKKTELARIIDQVPEYLAGMSPDMDIPEPLPNSVEHWIDLALNNNLSVIASRYDFQAKEAALGSARSEHTPTLDLVASYSENYSSGSTNTPDYYANKGNNKKIGLRFSMPIYSGGQTSSRVSQAHAQKYQAGAELELSKRQAKTDVRLAFSGVVDGLSRMSALQALVESGEQIVEQSHIGYKHGIYNNFKVLDAEKNYYAAKRDLVSVRYEIVLQALKLKAAVGDLSTQELDWVNTLLVD